MPADFTSGFFVRQPAWHGLGTVLDDYPASWDEARKIAGLEWEPVAAPAFGFVGKTADGSVTFDPATAATVELSNFQAIDTKQRIVRSDNGATLGVPSADYAVINHAELGAIVEAVIGQENLKYETTVVLQGGKMIAVVVRLDEPIELPGDNSLTFPFMALTTRHDGTGSCRAQSTTVRIVCGNTFAMAETEADRHGTVFTFSHTKNWRDHVDEARQAVQGLRTDFTEYVEFASHLTRLKVSDEQTATFLAKFIPDPMASVATSDLVMRNIEEARLTVKAILNSATCETVRGTAYGLLQAGGEYLDHYRGFQNKETYMGRQLLKPQKRKVELVKVITELVGA